MPPQRSQPFGLKTVSPLLKPSAASLGSASKSAVVRLRCVLQRSQSTRTSRWAITARSVDLSRTGINSGEHNGPRGIAGLCSIDQRRPACDCGNRESHRGRQRCERIVCRLRLDYHIGRKSVSPALKQLSALGLLDIQPGPRLVNGSAIAGARLTPSRLCASTTLLHDLTSLHRSDPLLCETDGPAQP